MIQGNSISKILKIMEIKRRKKERKKHKENNENNWKKIKILVQKYKEGELSGKKGKTGTIAMKGDKEYRRNLKPSVDEASRMEFDIND